MCLASHPSSLLPSSEHAVSYSRWMVWLRVGWAWPSACRSCLWACWSVIPSNCVCAVSNVLAQVLPVDEETNSSRKSGALKDLSSCEGPTALPTCSLRPELPALINARVGVGGSPLWLLLHMEFFDSGSRMGSADLEILEWSTGRDLDEHCLCECSLALA